MNRGDLKYIKEHINKVKVPAKNDPVCKSEACLSFAAPEFPGGLYTNLNTYQSYGEKYLDWDHNKTKMGLYLHQKWTKHKKTKKDDDVNKKPTKMQLGGEDGFDLSPDWEWKKVNSVMLMPRKTMLPFPNKAFPKVLNDTKDAIVGFEPPAQEFDTNMGWKPKESVHAKDLIQLDTGKKISSDHTQWKCEATGATHNLWLNLSDGYIGDGRPQPGSDLGGSGSALKHYEDTGRKYPLAVKLGTITPKGADVFSYAENDMVIDPYLAKHLAHWGINIMEMEKTELSMEEMQVKYNLQATFDRVLEAGKELEKVTGPGYLGLTNIGSSCYMNSLLQVLLAIPKFAKYYNDRKILEKSDSKPSQNFTVQMAKVAIAVLNNDLSVKNGKEEKEKEVKENKITTTTTTTATATAVVTTTTTTTTTTPLSGSENVPEGTGEIIPVPVCIRPKMFRDLVGKGHEDFSTCRQQDVFQYYQHFLSVLSQEDQKRNDKAKLHEMFTFEIEERIQCAVSKKVKYKITSGENVLSLPLAIEKGTACDEKEKESDKNDKEKESDKNDNEKKSKDDTVLQIPFDECLRMYAETAELSDFFSAETKKKGNATKQTRLASFPEYLVIQIQRFYLGDDFSSQKYRHRLLVPEKIDISMLASKGLQEGEDLLPNDGKDDQKGNKARIEPDMNIVNQLKVFGFTENACIKACIARNNSDVQACTEWLLQHAQDPDINDPLPVDGAPAPAQQYTAEDINSLVSMGFPEARAKRALQSCNGDKSRAVDWLFSHVGDENPEPPEPVGQNDEKNENDQGGNEQKGINNTSSGKYELASFITHMGPSATSGHYICHIKKDNKWTVFNDRKVNRSENPPFELGYLYFFRRCD